MSTSSEMVGNQKLDPEESTHKSPMDLKNSKKDIENGVINEFNNVNGVNESSKDSNGDVEMEENEKQSPQAKQDVKVNPTGKTNDNQDNIEMNGETIEESKEADEDICEDAEIDVEEEDEEKLLMDVDSDSQLNVNEGSLLKSDDEQIDAKQINSKPLTNGEKCTDANEISKRDDEKDTEENKNKETAITAESVSAEKPDEKPEIKQEVEGPKISSIDDVKVNEKNVKTEEQDENVSPKKEEKSRAYRLQVQKDRVEALKDELRSEEATLTLLRKLIESQRGRGNYKTSKSSTQVTSHHPKQHAPIHKPSVNHSKPPPQPQKPLHSTQKYYGQSANSQQNSNSSSYQYANGNSSHSYQAQTKPASQPPPPPPKQTPEQKKNAAKAALRRQLEHTLLQIPPPQPPPADWRAVPNVNSMDFMMLVGLDEVVDTILDLDNKPTLKKALEELTTYNPRICLQCKVDFSPCWKPVKGKSIDEVVLCERCALQNVKKELKAEHTSRLKSAFMKALKQEQEIEEKIKAGEDVNIPGMTVEKSEPPPSKHSPNTHAPINRNSPKLPIALQPTQQSSVNHHSPPTERHHQPSSGHHHRHQVVPHYPHHTSLVQQLHHQHIQQQQLELEPSSRHSSRWHPYMSSSSSHHRDHHPIHHRTYASGTPDSPRQEYYVVHHPHQNVRYVTR